RSTGCAATDGEALHLGCHDFLGLRVAQFQFNSDDAASIGLSDGSTTRGHVNATTFALSSTREFMERNTHVDDVVKVNCVEQALNNWEVSASWLTVLFGQATGAQRGVDCWPARANQSVWGACIRGAQGSAGDSGVCGQQGRRQGEGVLHQTIWIFLGDRTFDDLWQSGDLITGLRDGANTCYTSEQVKDCLGQTCIIDNWGSAGGYCLRQRNWDIHVFDVERTLFFWEVIPVGIRVDADSKAFAIINDVECIFWQFKCWVSNEVAMPHDGWRIAQEFFCRLCGS